MQLTITSKAFKRLYKQQTVQNIGFNVQSCPRIRRFSIRGFNYPRFTAARKKLVKLKE
jgi:hypothetical protein